MNEAHVITITEKPCSQCGKPESCDNGLCLKCTSKRITGRGMKIGEKTIAAGIDILQSLLWEKQMDMERAMIRNEEDALTVSLSLKITPDGSRNKVKGNISFTVEKAKGETDDVYVDENQMDLPLKEKAA